MSSSDRAVVLGRRWSWLSSCRTSVSCSFRVAVLKEDLEENKVTGVPHQL